MPPITEEPAELNELSHLSPVAFKTRKTSGSLEHRALDSISALSTGVDLTSPQSGPRASADAAFYFEYAAASPKEVCMACEVAETCGEFKKPS